MAANAARIPLAEMAVKETRMGVMEDKASTAVQTWWGLPFTLAGPLIIIIIIIPVIITILIIIRGPAEEHANTSLGPQ